MAELKNRKHEAFCQNYINNPDINYNGTKSYQEVYPDAKDTSAGTNSYELLKNTEIKARIDELQAEKTERNRHKVHKIEAEFYDLKDDSENEFVKARCLENIARLNGLFIDKKLVEHSGSATINIPDKFIPTDEN